MKGTSVKVQESTPEEVAAFVSRKLLVDAEEGILSLSGSRLFLGDPAILVTIQRELENLMGLAARAPLYAAGEATAQAVAEVVKRFLSQGRFSDDREAIRHLFRIWSAYGYGRIEVVSVDPAAGRAEFTVANSVVADAYGPSKGPVCHFFAGFGAGLFQALFGVDVHCHETACASADAERCRFEMAPLEVFHRPSADPE